MVALSLVAGSPVIGSPSLPSAYAFGLEDRVLDFGLHVLDAEADKFYLCSNVPTTYAEVLSFALGVKDMGAGNAFGSPAGGTPSGRMISSVAFSDGTHGDGERWTARAGTCGEDGGLPTNYPYRLSPVEEDEFNVSDCGAGKL